MKSNLFVVILAFLILGGCRFRGGYSMLKSSSTQMYSPYFGGNVTDQDIKAGTLTAGEVNDFEKWERWNDLSEGDLNLYKTKWAFYLTERYSVQVTNVVGEPISNQNVILLNDNNNTIWTALTDNTGRAELWNGAYGETKKVKSINVYVNGTAKIIEKPTVFEKGINFISIDKACEQFKKVDILFAVDATGSMGDEIEYLKTEILDIMEGTQQLDTTLDVHLGGLFYRCLGNSYVTRKWDFTPDFEQVGNFIKEQSADEGGLEAVEVALKEGIRDMSWRDDAHAKLLFIVLDEAPGNSVDILKRIHQDIQFAALKGIHIVPLIASGTGYSSDKSLEYLMRSMALATNGTTAFLTGHSGIGSSHTAPSTDSYDVEKMNKLILRIIARYSISYECGTDLNSFLSQIKDTTSVEIIEHVVVQRLLDTLTEHKIFTTDSMYTKDVDSSDLVIEVSDSVDVNNEEMIEKIVGTFKFYPNPTSGIINIQCSDSISTIYLSDANGRLLERFESNNMNQFQIDISKNPPGLYLIQCLWNEKWFSGKVLMLK